MTTNTARKTYWTTDDIAAMSDAALADFIAICQNGERTALMVRNSRAMRRYSFLLERLAYPEQDRRLASKEAK